MCQEYRGPTRQYDELGIDHLWLPSIDHYCPKLDALEAAVSFIQKHQDLGQRVYVHCRAGHGRSAAAVYCWLLSKQPNVDRKLLNEQLRTFRNVKSTLWKEPAIVKFHSRLLQNHTSSVHSSTTFDEQSDDGVISGDEL
jgi:atypical dual specificity phosphatase